MAVATPPNGSAPATRVPRRVLTREYVAGGRFAATGTSVKVLPSSIDDLTADFGADLYQRMLHDPQVAACVTVLKTSILEEGLALAPAIADKADARYADAVAIRDEAEAMLAELPLDDVLWNLLDALAFGNKVAEQIYAMQTGLTGRRLLQLVALKPKPRPTTAFAVDQYLNVLGLVAGTGGAAGVASGSAARENLLPRQKFAVLTFRPRDGDPRGTSILRPAYDPWWRKRQVLPEYLKYLSQFAGPSVWGTPPEGSQAQPATDGLGNVTNEAVQTPEQALLEALLTWRNGTALAVPYGTEVHPVEMKGNGLAFINAGRECNAEIVTAILTQRLATEEGTHQARAAAQVHQDVLDTVVRQGKRGVVRMVRYDILRPWVTYNWGEQARSLTPLPSLGTTEEHDLPAMMNAVANLMRAAYLHPSQFAEIDRMLGVPVRDLTQDEPAATESPESTSDQRGEAPDPDEEDAA
jgi:phage gp29-like protein